MDWHPIDLGSKVVRQRDGECAERPAGYIEAEKTSTRNVDESLRKYMGDFQHSPCCARESCNNKKVTLIVHENTKGNVLSCRSSMNRSGLNFHQKPQDAVVFDIVEHLDLNSDVLVTTLSERFKVSSV